MAEGRRVVRSEFGNQKPESVLDIFCAATSKSRISRAEIAKMTGLSVVTVGKVVDALLSLKILRQTTSLDPAPGRKSRVLSAAGGLNIVVFNLATPSYTVHICDLMQHTVDTYTYHYNADYFPDENLHFFSSKVQNTQAKRSKFKNAAAVPSSRLGTTTITRTAFYFPVIPG